MASGSSAGRQNINFIGHIMKARHRLFAIAALAGLASLPAQAATWSTSAQYGSWNNGGYTLYNNIWGSGAGPQTLWANSYSNWGVWANHPNTDGIKSYPNVSRYIGKTINSLNTLTATFSATTPSGGMWTSTFDVWDASHDHEVMIWMNYTAAAGATSGLPQPISYNWTAAGYAKPVYTSVSVGGHTWNIFRGDNGANLVYSFIRTSKTNNATVDIKAILKWLVSKGWMTDTTVGEVQYGFEISQSYPGKDFVTNRYWVTSN
jgi:hypothetical protein